MFQSRKNQLIYKLHMTGTFFINGLILTLNKDIVVSFNFNIDLQVLSSSFQ